MTIRKQRADVSRFLRFLEQRLSYVLAAILFRVLLEWAYVVFVSRHYSHAGFPLDFSAAKYVESWMIYILIAVYFPRVLRKASDYLFTFLFSGVLAPMLVMFAYADKSRFGLYCVLLGTLLVVLLSKGRPIGLSYVRGGQAWGISLMLILAGAVTAWYISSGGLAFFNLDLTKVYDFRRDAGEVTGVGVMSYVNMWAPKVAGPVLLAFCLWKKMYVSAATVISLHVFWFGVSANKAVIFYPMLVVFLWFWFRYTGALSIVLLGMSGAIAGSMFFYFVADDMFMSAMMVRRAFFSVAANTFDYYEFFSQHPKVFWSNSLTSTFIEYPYQVNPPLLIGQWRGTESHVNNSFLSTAYMHAGIAGIIIYGALTGFLFRLIDSMVHKAIPLWVGVASIIVPSYSLIVGADLPTALLTHGVGLALVILFLLRQPLLSRKIAQSGASVHRMSSSSIVKGI